MKTRIGPNMEMETKIITKETKVTTMKLMEIKK